MWDVPLRGCSLTSKVPSVLGQTVFQSFTEITGRKAGLGEGMRLVVCMDCWLGLVFWGAYLQETPYCLARKVKGVEGGAWVFFPLWRS